MLARWAKLLAAPLAVLALTAAYYEGAFFTVTFPDIGAPTEIEGGLIEVRDPDTGANCNVDTQEIPSLRSLTPDQINTQFGHVWTLAEWADLLGAPEATLEMVSTTAVERNGRFMQIATMRTTSSEGAPITFMRGHFILPGRITMIGCYARTAIFPQYEARFDAAVRSLRPR